MTVLDKDKTKNGNKKNCIFECLVMFLESKRNYKFKKGEKTTKIYSKKNTQRCPICFKLYVLCFFKPIEALII